MKALNAVGVILLVFGFLCSSLGLFPIGNVSANTDDITEDTSFSVDAFEQTSRRFSYIYTTVDEDIASFAGNPDLSLAQSRRNQMLVYAGAFANDLNVFADSLQGRLDELTTPLTAPMGVTANARDGIVALNWDDNPEAELQGYHIYRSTVAGGIPGSSQRTSVSLRSPTRAACTRPPTTTSSPQ